MLATKSRKDTKSDLDPKGAGHGRNRDQGFGIRDELRNLNSCPWSLAPSASDSVPNPLSGPASERSL